MIEMYICVRNWPDIRMLIISSLELSRHSAATFTQLANAHNSLVVRKSCLMGARMILSKIKSLNINATMARTSTATMERTRCHLNSSRWSQNDISLSLFCLGGCFFVVVCSGMILDNGKFSKSCKMNIFDTGYWILDSGS